MSRSASLLRAAHLGPSLTVTAVAALLAIALGIEVAGSRALGVAVVVAAVGSGQLCIGWTNDLLDRDRDLASRRPDKPLAQALVSRRAVRRAAWLSGASCVPFSLLLGLAAGTAHLAAVGCGLAYDVRLKATTWSWLPFALAFGLLPTSLWWAAGQPVPGWAAVAGSLLGVGAHLANALPDLEDDRRHGVLGLPQRWGERRTRVAAAFAVLAATVVLAWVPPNRSAALAWAMTAIGVVVVALAVGRRWPPGNRGSSRAPFVIIAGLALVDVGVLVLTATVG